MIVDLIDNEVPAKAKVSAANVKARSAGRSHAETWVTMSADVKGDAYQANPASPIFDELCGIVRKTMGLAEPPRKARGTVRTFPPS